MKNISILGSTGSIGRSTLSVVECHPERFRVVALAAGNNVAAATEQAHRWKPKLISMATGEAAAQLRSALGRDVAGIETASGTAGAVRVATHPDCEFVVSAIV